MTEQDYINVSELRTIRIAIQILPDIVPENSNVISKKKFKKVLNQLYEWEAALYLLVAIDTEGK